MPHPFGTPFSVTLTLEAVQNGTVRFILFNSYPSSITTFKIFTVLPNIYIHRHISRLCLHHKFFCNSYIRMAHISEAHHMSARLDHSHKVEVNRCVAITFQNNSLPGLERLECPSPGNCGSHQS